MERIVQSFVGIPEVDLTVICGNTKKIDAPRGVRAKILGYETNMPARMAEADVVVGKAGGLTVTEALTAGRPMVIASAIPGNEAVNARFVVESGAGFAVRAEDVGEVIERFHAPGLLRAMGRRARSLVRRGAADTIVDVAISVSRRPTGLRESA
jgi:processive 1,2-diacylglycerol beta-glucosyltransferase